MHIETDAVPVRVQKLNLSGSWDDVAPVLELAAAAAADKRSDIAPVMRQFADLLTGTGLPQIHALNVTKDALAVLSGPNNSRWAASLAVSLAILTEPASALLAQQHCLEVDVMDAPQGAVSSKHDGCIDSLSGHAQMRLCELWIACGACRQDALNVIFISMQH